MTSILQRPARPVAGIELDVTLAPVRRLTDGALAAVELQLRAADAGALHSAQELRRVARLMDEKHDLDRIKADCITDPQLRALVGELPVMAAFDAPYLTDTGSTLPPAPSTRILASVSAHLFGEAPHGMLRALGTARERGNTICLEIGDDADHALAFLALIEPDVIVVTPTLLHAPTSAETARIVHALAAHAERSHCTIIAEGVNDEATRATAETIGTTFGIGELYPALPAETLLAEDLVPLPAAPVWTTPDVEETTPFALATRDTAPRRGTKSLLIEMSKALEAQATGMAWPMVAIGTFQHSRHFTQSTAARWNALSEVTGFAGVYGTEIVAASEGNVHRAPLAPGDPLVDEWTVAVVGPHFSALIAARDRHDNGPDLERTFDFVQTFDRTTTVQAVRSVLHRFG